MHKIMHYSVRLLSYPVVVEEEHVPRARGVPVYLIGLGGRPSREHVSVRLEGAQEAGSPVDGRGVEDPRLLAHKLH